MAQNQPKWPKTVRSAVEETHEPGSRLRSELTTAELTAIGLAVVVGAGIFSSAPTTYRNTGPSIVIAFAVAAIACAAVAICFAECTTRVPVAGSTYTFTCVAFGRGAGRLVAGLLFLEYTVGPAVVARSWADNLRQLLIGLGVPVPVWPEGLVAAGIIVVVVALLAGGLRVASTFTLLATGAKVLVLVIAVVAGLTAWSLGTVTEPDPDTAPLVVAPGSFAVTAATLTAASTLFYAFIGFDSVSTLAEEARSPRTSLRRATLATLGIAALLYLLVAVTMVLLAPERLAGPTLAAVVAGAGLHPVAIVLGVGALVGLAAGILVLLLGQSRIAVAMGRDRFLPSWLVQLTWSRTPARALYAAGAMCALLALIFPAEELQPVVNLGTLLLFVIVCLAAVFLPRKDDDSIGQYRPGWIVIGSAIAGCVLSALLIVFLLREGSSWIALAAVGGTLAVGAVGHVVKERYVSRAFTSLPGLCSALSARWSRRPRSRRRIRRRRSDHRRTGRLLAQQGTPRFERIGDIAEPRSGRTTAAPRWVRRPERIDPIGWTPTAVLVAVHGPAMRREPADLLEQQSTEGRQPR